MNEFLAIIVESQTFDSLLHNLEQAIDEYNLNQTAEKKQLLEYHLLLLFQKIMIEKIGGLENFLDEIKKSRQASELMKHFKTQS